MTTIDLPRDSTLERVADSLAILASSKASEMTMDWPTLARLVKTGGAKSILSIGDLIEESWTDKSPAEPKAYSLPWGVRHFGQVELEDGKTTNGLFLQTHYATVKACQFSHPRAFLRCPDGLSAGTYYVTFAESFGSKIIKGEVFTFTLTQDVPAGGRLAGLTYAGYDSPRENWKVSSYDETGKTIIETVATTAEADGTSLGDMYSAKRNGNLNSSQEMSYGWNCWAKSAYRQYLNSSADKGAWWTAQDEWDIKPDQLDSMPGFLSGLPQELIDAMLPVKTRTYLNTALAAETGKDYVDTYDKVFLPSLQQMYIVPQVADEGETWDYWKLIAGVDGQFKQYTTLSKLIQYATDNRTSAQNVRVRSAHRGYAYDVWYVSAAGTVGGYTAGFAYRACPACVIGKI